MIIVFDGVEGTGKTTLIQLLKNELDKLNFTTKILKHNKGNERETKMNLFKNTNYLILLGLTFYAEDLLNIQNEKVILIDRGILTMIIYNTLNKNLNPKKLIEFYKDVFKEHIDLYIVLIANKKDIIQRTQNRNRNFDNFNIDLIEQRQKLFIKYGKKLFKDKVLIFNTSKTPLETIKNTLIKIIKKEVE